MPLENAIFLAGIIVAFVLFGTVLAYVDRIAARRREGTPAE